MQVDPSQFTEIPDNRHGVQAGSLLFPTEVPIVAGGGSSQDFVHEQGGDDDTFIFMLGARAFFSATIGDPYLLEGVFLTKGGPGFHPTWDLEQLMRETDLGGWKVVPTQEVLEQWVETVERRMNAR